ncbi:hypothetical protein CDQ84_19180 [Clostridium thermosuccinogenes]|uniref:Uncharacterized protein n=1 Tax=Clostridium thermosuccinogenes TaxID=84032 RepID=A0A2K2EYV1_9CLOT|nr:hypothetical protein [Pseudoclostridium thermosuccinogenes]AUS97316.1 hypothetical protein CDO33_13240 [Pseudoclostridium thermosuccinogenes]PNT91697.1 hypothetical protein CDQ85_19160 [Pseudoclostridium thermosuccinogenes]PNT91808.1 hypothetical protein CDQ84_19180 [Pseudoclostridium thermosuccinogenes]
MNSNYTYTQPQKKSARHKALAYAVEILTFERNNACCVKRNYVRKVYDYFASLDDCNDKKEVEKIDVSYINYWEKLHDSCVGYKRPEDLYVCYLCGPEPNNDFQELINLGILPQNIWAFENNLTTYKAALSSYDLAEFPQPKIIKQQIETFFQQTPKKFDIVYIDACGAIPSKQHALRCFSSLCKYHRLNSPGIVISNFAEPDTMSENINEYHDLLALYFLFKRNPNIQILLEDFGIHSEEFDALREQISKEFTYFYGEFISSILRDSTYAKQNDP